jgi:hypothetical protein
MVAILDFFGLQIIGAPCRYVTFEIIKSTATHLLWDLCKKIILILEMLKVLELAHPNEIMEVAHVSSEDYPKLISQ